MENLFPDLYRFTGETPDGVKLYTYLLIREDGNLLLPTQDGPVSDHFDEIDALGGVAAQYVTHNHDIGSTVHDAVHDRFGAKLHYRNAEHEAVSEKTKCPAE